MSRQQRRQRQTRTPVAPSPGAIDLPLWKKLLFSLVACGLFFGVLEGGLALIGVPVSLYQSDPYVGFAKSIPHFVPGEGRNAGLLVTAENKRRVLNLQRFVAHKAPGTIRIFCLGGSTTYGHPYTDSTSFCGWLREMLPQADPSRRWELINGGGISYASYREALLMEELIRYQPDLFIVLSAHNEFLEQRTYGQIIAMPPVVRGLGAALSHTRIHTVMKAGVDRLGAPDPARIPATQLAENPEAILDRTIGPQSYHRDDVQRKHVIDHYRFNLARMVDIARSAGARVLFITPASNLRDCAPFKNEHRAGLGPAELAQWQTLLAEAIAARKSGRLDQALRQVDQAAAIDDRRADLHFLRGHVLAGLNRYVEAKAAFERARDEDVCPLRALGSMMEATAAVAAERGMPLVDFTKLLEGRAAHGIPGEDWFLDHVHPTIEGHRQLALEILRVMEKEGLLQRADSWTESAQLEIKRVVESRISGREQATALVTLAKVLAWAGKHDEAYRVALRAVALAPDDAAMQFEVGKGASRVGQREDAIRGLRKAVELNPRFVEARSLLGLQLLEKGQAAEGIQHGREAVALRPEDPQLLLNLGAMLDRSGQAVEAEEVFRRAVRLSPGFAEAHNNLGWLLKDRGAFTEAQDCFREAVRLRPGSIMPGLGLAWLLAAHPDAARRNPAEAVRLAERLSEQSGQQNWISLDTLAVAYAAAGRFPDAIQAGSGALEQLKAAGRSEATKVAERLALFRQNQPFVERPR